MRDAINIKTLKLKVTNVHLVGTGYEYEWVCFVAGWRRPGAVNRITISKQSRILWGSAAKATRRLAAMKLITTESLPLSG